MGFKDNIVKQKDGSYMLKSKTKKAKTKGACTVCGENNTIRDLLYQYNAMDMILVRQYIEDHLTSHPKHEAITPEWCEKCKVLKGYRIKLKDEKNN
tara:strand:- start:1004 stop:1291 length:288 start_codon:yes stop_codon:yes gene_type:complete